ncbi:MAG: rhomboid family intramembrane serine protease, partial [Candidatus Nanopelagicales bacterium]|nr:rhomboid family intramembrane serine protease [Candidatus Nanopelagicales bacterium]
MTEASGPAPEPVCSRHPDRVSYIQCTRCGNPICTECMIPAAVGFQCPSCVSSARVAPVHTPAGGAEISRPYVTYALIGINIAVFLWQLSLGIDQSATSWGMWPVGIATQGEYWSLLSSAFLHG